MQEARKKNCAWIIRNPRHAHVCKQYWTEELTYLTTFSVTWKLDSNGNRTLYITLRKTKTWSRVLKFSSSSVLKHKVNILVVLRVSMYWWRNNRFPSLNFFFLLEAMRLYFRILTVRYLLISFCNRKSLSKF